jgi:hypothetical protein
MNERTFSNQAMAMWPPSRGSNGSRLKIPTEEVQARQDQQERRELTLAEQLPADAAGTDDA